MAAVKYKPIPSARMLDAQTHHVQEKTKKTVQGSQSAVARSKELIAQSKKVIKATRKRKAE